MWVMSNTTFRWLWYKFGNGVNIWSLNILGTITKGWDIVFIDQHELQRNYVVMIVSLMVNVQRVHVNGP